MMLMQMIIIIMWVHVPKQVGHLSPLDKLQFRIITMNCSYTAVNSHRNSKVIFHFNVVYLMAFNIMGHQEVPGFSQVGWQAMFYNLLSDLTFQIFQSLLCGHMTLLTNNKASFF